MQHCQGDDKLIFLPQRKLTEQFVKILYHKLTPIIKMQSVFVEM